MLEVDDLRVVVLGIEDLLVDRRRAWVHRRSEEDGRWARRLVALHGERMDPTDLRGRVAGEPADAAALARLEAA